MIDGVDETIDSMTNRSYFLVADRLSRGEIVEEQWHIITDYTMARRDLGYINCRFVSRRGASLHPGTDVSYHNKYQFSITHNAIVDWARGNELW